MNSIEKIDIQKSINLGEEWTINECVGKINEIIDKINEIPKPVLIVRIPIKIGIDIKNREFLKSQMEENGYFGYIINDNVETVHFQILQVDKESQAKNLDEFKEQLENIIKSKGN